MMSRSLLVLMLTCGPSVGATEPVAFLSQHCVSCHGANKPEAGLRLDGLAGPDADHAGTWALIADRVEFGDMPPASEPRPDSAARREFVRWIGRELRSSTPSSSPLRRLSRYEYQTTLHDLLGIETELMDLLPEDSSLQGFDNVAGGLGISSILLERYLEAANLAFDGTIRRIEPLPPQTRRAVLMENNDNVVSVDEKKGGVITREGAFIDFSPGWPPARVDAAHPIEAGRYRCRVAVWPHQPGPDRTLAVAVFTGPLFGTGKRNFQGVFDVTGTPEQPRIIEFTTLLAEGDALHVLPWVYPEHVTWRDKHEEQPGVAIVWAETHGPLDQSFPSESQTRLFGDRETISLQPGTPIWMRHRKGVKEHTVDSSDPRADAARIIREFVPRAFRRPVPDHLVQPFVDLALSRLEEGSTFEQAVRAGVTGVLCSPHFLLLNSDRSVDDYTLASRLSYFLWSSMPDVELLRLAADGTLRDPAVRHAQVERMLKDPKSERFVRHFTDQWLDLNKIEFTTPDAKLYPEYDELLLRSMLAETRGFFRHVLDNDLGVTSFVDSDFAVLNQRLANLYGIDGVRGHEEFRVVALPSDSIRGGVLTQASILKVTANGTTTSPVLRGVWVLDKLLGQPAPPPPPGVPAVEPDIRGATTIREQLAKHAESATCNRCHARIDPAGFALEEFDVIGNWRTRYRSVEGKREDRVDRTNYYLGLAVESDGELIDERRFRSFDEYRQCLLADREQLARSLATKLLVYGCGRPVTRRDQPAVDAIVDSTSAGEFGLRSMIHAVVDSELFLEN
ncbi:MAG: DUF1592 domain-containing protein [Planctomycetaceae bacterium]